MNMDFVCLQIDISWNASMNMCFLCLQIVFGWPNKKLRGLWPK
jgi:hypothetical protein